ncbi:MAG: PAS domain S-box protein [Firmicutes bacterium]|nr:PAS domain S-box protein [Bacillota bacterium]
MPWIIGFEFSTALIGFVLFVVYMYLFIMERKGYIRLWMFSWAIYSMSYIFKFLMHEWSDIVFIRIAEAMFAIWSSFFLVWGLYGFLGKKISKWLIFAWFILSISVVIGIKYNYYHFLLPTVFISVIYIWIGILLLRSVTIEGAGKYLTGITFSLWGVHVADYPFLSQIEGFAPWGYIIGNTLLVIGALGILLIYFEKTRNDLKTSQQHLHIIADNMTDMILKTDIEGIFQYVSSSTKNLLGYEPADILGKSFLEFIHPEDVEQVKRDFDKVHDTGTAGRLEYRYRHASGYYVWVEAIRNPLYDDKQKFIGQVACVREITKRKRTEAALRESEKRYRQVVEFFPDCIVVYKNGKIIFANTAAGELVGAKNGQKLSEKSLMWHVHPAYREVARTYLRKVDEERETIGLHEYKIIKHDGTFRDIEAAAIPIHFEQGNAALIIVRDITERKMGAELKKKVEEKTRELKEALEIDKLKTDFFANISHELRTPLNIILGTMQLFDLYQQKGMTENTIQKTDKRIKVMKQNCYRLLRLINNLIDITKMDAGYYSLKLQNHNIVNIIEEIALSIRDFIQDKGIHFQFDTDVEEKIIACDPDKIERIILNLLSNAVKFSNSGGSISVNIYDKGERILISIQDTGTGIPKDKLQLIFERFRQVERSLTRNHSGSGIGLSLVKSLVELHGGSIRAESEYGKGSEFIIEIPVKVLPKEEIVTADKDLLQSRIERINIEFSDIYSQ